MTTLTLQMLRWTTQYHQIKQIFDYDSCEKEDLQRCPGCQQDGTRSFPVFGEIDRYGYHVITKWCVRCALLFITPRMPLDVYNRFYETGAYRKIVSVLTARKSQKSERVAGLFPKRLRPFQTIVPRYQAELRHAKVLDIGGTKDVFHYLRQAVNLQRYVCINPAATEVELAGNGEMSFFHGTIEEYESPAEPFNLICLFGTLNHLLQPGSAFKKIGDLLQKGGLFVFDHVNRLEKMRMSRHPSHHIQIDHPVYPGTATVEWLLHQSGMKVVEKHPVTSGVDFYLAQKTESPPPLSLDAGVQLELNSLASQMKLVSGTFFVKSVMRNWFSKRQHPNGVGA